MGDWVLLKNRENMDFFFQNNIIFLTISLVSIVWKLFRELTSQVCKSGIHCSKSSARGPSLMELEF